MTRVDLVQQLRRFADTIEAEGIGRDECVSASIEIIDWPQTWRATLYQHPNFDYRHWPKDAPIG